MKISQTTKNTTKMVSRLSHGVEVENKRWNHCKVHALNKHAFQPPSLFLPGPSFHSLLKGDERGGRVVSENVNNVKNSQFFSSLTKIRS